MVQLPNLGKVSVKTERECLFDEDFGSYGKRPKIDYTIQEFSPQTTTSGLINEPSPLGLRLKKTPSFLDFVQTKLSQSNSNHEERKLLKTNRSKDPSNSNEKLKASNFPACLLQIGDWERVSRYEGDLVGKCYFAKHKLVWEVLEGGLKSKIEIQWSEISAIKASFPKEGHETLEVVLARQPLFFRETNPQPRKHTLWQATSDFTGGQASLHRRHYLECEQGFMIKHFEKLIRCDTRLYMLSQQPEINLENPFFECDSSLFEGERELGFVHSNSNNNNNNSYRSESVPQSFETGMGNEVREFENRIPNVMIQEGLPISGMDSQFKMPGLRPSMSRSEIMNQIGHQIYKQINSPNNNNSTNQNSQIKAQFEELAQYLLTDSQNPNPTAGPSDEKYLMSRVDSLCCLIQKDNETEGRTDLKADLKGEEMSSTDLKADLKWNDSFGDLLMQLPRIASYPNFL
ncbi:hypothetical protein LUZ60_008830 [Juncus effusus]|nr:hypothetical protein LUZ60_008830 [Juncus effusus]